MNRLTPYYADAWLTVYEGDCRAVMAAMEPESVQCVVTSPPYFGLRDYGIPPTVWGGEDHEHEWGATLVQRGPAQAQGATSQRGGRANVEAQSQRGVEQGSSCSCGAWLGVLGLEPSPELYIAHMVEVFRLVRRVLRKDGVVWLNLGDSYASAPAGNLDYAASMARSSGLAGAKSPRYQATLMAGHQTKRNTVSPGFKPKDRLMIPARVAIALQADGWWLRDEIVWSKPNPMPSSVEDRTTPAHEMVYLLTRSARYHYDGAAIAEPLAVSSIERLSQPTFDSQTGGPKDYGNGTNPNQSARKALENFKYKHDEAMAAIGKGVASANRVFGDEAAVERMLASGRNRRSVWTIPAAPYPEAHFATFPPKLVEPMILAGCPSGGVVLDPFAGSGTVGAVAQAHSRRAVLIDLSADYLVQVMRRNRDVPLGLVTA